MVRRPCGLWLGLIGLAGWLLLQPLQAAIHISSGLYQESTLKVGQTTQNRLSIQNLGDEAQTVLLYQRDELFDEGLSTFLPVGSNERSNASWIALETERLLVPAQTTLAVPYQLRVPIDDQLQGSYWSVVMVQAETADWLEITSDAQSGVAIQQTFRTAVRVVTHLDSEPQPEPVLSLDQSAIRLNDDGQVRLDLYLANLGVLGLHLKVFAEVIGATGQSLGRFSPRYDRVRLLPTSEATRTIDLPDLAGGRYEIILVAENHDGQLFGARYVLTIGAQ